MREHCHGSVIGADHISVGKTLVGRNSQDAVVVRESANSLVAVVCDGCGSGAHSEVGAWLGANQIANLLIEGTPPCPEVMESVRHILLGTIYRNASDIGRLTAAINDYFLFTCVGLVVTGRKAFAFHIGDGVIGGKVDGLEFHTVVGVKENNAPSYVAYDLIKSSIAGTHELTFQIIEFGDNWDYLYIGSDGLDDFAKAENKLFPGTQTPVGPISQFADDWYFSNKDALSRKLKLCNTESVRIDPETKRKVTHHRLLPDDTSIVLVRNSPPASSSGSFPASDWTMAS